MAVMGMSADMSQLRTQQTLAMQSSSSSSAAPAAAADPATQMAAAAATGTSGGADAAMAAQAVQPPPSTSKVVLQSVLKGAMSGASVMMGIKSAAPILGKIGFIKNLAGPAIGFLGKLPILGSLMPKILAGGPMGFLITALVGAAVGGIVGLVRGLRSAKQQAADYADAVAQQQAATQTPPADPATTPPPATGPAPAASDKRHVKSWIIAREGDIERSGGKFGSFTPKKTQSIALLAKRFHTTPAEIRKLNPGLTGNTVPGGTTLKLRRQVIPTAKAYAG